MIITLADTRIEIGEKWGWKKKPKNKNWQVQKKLKFQSKIHTYQKNSDKKKE